MCNLRIQRDASDVRLSRGDMTWLRLLSSADAGTVEYCAMSTGLGGQSLDHWRGVIWDPGIVDQQGICVCYDCLCLITLFRTISLLMQDWAVWPVWTGIGSRYCRTITWELGCLRSLLQPCDVDLLCAKMIRQIKERNDNNRLQRCTGVRGTSLGVLSAGGIPIRVIGRFGCGRGSVGCSDWLRVCGAVIISPGGVRIGYIRRAMCGRFSTDAKPVTGSLVFFAPLDCLNVSCAAECASCWLFCGTDCACLASFRLFIWQVSISWIMAMEGAALVEACAGITFGVELYVPWDTPDAVVDMHSEGFVPLGSIPDVVGLVGRRRRIRPVRVMSESVGDLPVLTLQDPADAQGAFVYDCRPPLPPVSLQLCNLGPLSARRTEVSASVSVSPWDN